MSWRGEGVERGGGGGEFLVSFLFSFLGFLCGFGGVFKGQSLFWRRGGGVVGEGGRACTGRSVGWWGQGGISQMILTVHRITNWVCA